MNGLYQDLYYQASMQCFFEGESDAWTWEKRYAELIVKECLSQMSDHLDKQRVIKHFELED
jgi:hypothetical protein